MRRGIRHFVRAPEFYMGVIAFLLYLRTLAPDVFVSDFAEFQYHPPILGLPHPNGFPLYMLMGWAWSRIPWGTWAWRMNILSAVWGGIAVGLTTGFARRLSSRTTVGVLAGGLWALTPSFWGYALLAERYTLNMSLLIAALWTAWETTRSSNPRFYRLLSSLLLGLGLTVHPSDALLIPFWWGYLLWRSKPLRRDLRAWGESLLAGALPLSLFLYVPWRWAVYARWPLLPGIERSEAVYKGLVHVWYEPPLRWDLVWHYVAGLGGYAGGFLRGGWIEAIPRLNWVWPYWRTEIPWVFFPLALVGFFFLYRREKVLTITLLAFAAYLTLMVAYIQQGKNDAYLLPTFWIVLFMVAFSAEALEQGGHLIFGRWTNGLIYASTVFLLLSLLVSRYTHRDLSRRVDIRDTWLATLATPMDAEAGLLGHWSDLTPLWYLQQAEHRRPDLWGLFPPDGEHIIAPWLAEDRALYLIAPLHGWAPHLPKQYHLIPWGPTVRILPQGDKLSCFQTLNQHEEIHTPMLDMARPTLPSALSPEKLSVLIFCWRARTSVPRNTFLELRLTSAEGVKDVTLTAPLISRWYPLSSVPAGEEGLSTFPIRLPWGTPPGQYGVHLRFFRLNEDGTGSPFPTMPELPLGEVMIVPTRHFTRARMEQATVPPIAPIAGPLRLKAWFLSPKPVRPGDPVRLDMVWEVRRPPRARLSLQVRFWGRSGWGKVTPRDPLLPASGPDVWRPGTILHTRHVLRAPRGLGDHIYVVEVRLFEGEQSVLWLPTLRWIAGWIRVHDRPHLWKPPQGFKRVEAHFDGVAELTGYRVDPDLKVTLLWRAKGKVDASYKVFVHLVDKRGRIVAQHDSLPAQNTLPTDVWVPGEYIVDEHPLPRPDKSSPPYTLRVGLYDPNTGHRVSVSSSQLPVRDNSVVLEVQPTDQE